MTSQWIKIPCPACGPLAREVVGSAELTTDELNAITEYLLDQHRVWAHQTTRAARPALPGGDWRVTRKHLDPPALGRVSMDDERLWIVYKMHGSHYVALRAFRSEQRANDWASSLQREQTCVEELEYDPRQGSDCNG